MSAYPPNFRLTEPEFVAVVGGREMEWKPVQDWMADNLDKDLHVVVTGDARGADAAAVDFAKTNGFVYILVPAKHLWGPYGRAGGMIRNPIVARLATERVVAFPDPESRGTHDTTAYATSIGKKVIFPLGNGQVTIWDEGVL